MQSTISQYGAVGFPGLLHGVANPLNVESFAAQASINMGRAVQRGGNPEKQVVAATTGAAAIGFSVHDHARTQGALGTGSAGLVAYAATETVSVMKEGQMWVETEDAVVAGSVANYVTASGKVTDAPVAAGIEAFTQISVKFMTGTTAAGLAVIEVK